MKFKVDTDDGQQISSYIHFTEQGIPGFSTNGKVGGPEICRERLEMKEKIQREIEKDKIRREIIAAEMEMERRRVLEEEVRNEMMMERQMAMRSSGEQFMPLPLPLCNKNVFEPRVLHQKPSGSQVVPFQGIGDSSKVSVFPVPLPLISEKEAIVLGKPNGETTLSGIKRKQTPTDCEGSSEICGDGSRKKQMTVGWNCAVCQVSTTNERGLNEHVNGKKHKLKEAALIASKTGANFGLGVAAMNAIVKPVKLALKTVDVGCSDTKKSETGPKTGKSSNTQDSNRYKFWCEICQVGTFHEKVMNSHRDGKKHLKTLAILGSKDPATQKTEDTEEKTKTETNEVLFENRQG